MFLPTNSFWKEPFLRQWQRCASEDADGHGVWCRERLPAAKNQSQVHLLSTVVGEILSAISRYFCVGRKLKGMMSLHALPRAFQGPDFALSISCSSVTRWAPHGHAVVLGDPRGSLLERVIKTIWPLKKG